ncbi:MAG TPA: flavodoxin family protein [Desulfarculaceae bacterium]|nr:flavodoxin family protein [Desulfarculaceae bacterium]
MKKNIVALILSPRESGNCEILTKEICRHIPEEHELTLVRLTGKDIKPCKGCYACLVSGSCPLSDDFLEVAEAMAKSDALIIASPTYFIGANGVLKVFLDRCLQLFSAKFSVRGKPVINLVTAGIKGEAGYSEMMLNSFSLILGLKLRASEIFYGALPGEVFYENNEQLQRAADLGAKLFSTEERAFAGWACPLCGSDVIQLLGGNKIQCVVCRNYGEVVNDGKNLTLKVTLNSDNIFFTEEQAGRHGLWLQEMKSRFMQLRRKLAKITGPYADDGKWL